MSGCVRLGAERPLTRGILITGAVSVLKRRHDQRRVRKESLGDDDIMLEKKPRLYKIVNRFLEGYQVNQDSSHFHTSTIR